jgi:hypothetical protein
VKNQQGSEQCNCVTDNWQLATYFPLRPMPLTLTDCQSERIARALRRGAMDSLRIADAINPAGRTHFYIEVTDMGQFAKDWEQLKQIIRQKDDALDRQAAQIADLQKQLAASQQQMTDGDDARALAEAHQTVATNPPIAPAPAPAAKSAPSPAVTTFNK